MNNDAFSAGTETANTGIRFLKASGSKVWRYISRWAGGRVSRVFWYRFDDMLVPTRRFEKGREIRVRDKGGGGTGRVRSLVALSHRMTRPRESEDPGRPWSPRSSTSLVSFHGWPRAQLCFTAIPRRVSSIYPYQPVQLDTVDFLRLCQRNRRTSLTHKPNVSTRR